MEYRVEHDSMGEVKVPANKYWAAQTERSHENFNIGVGIETMPREITKAFGVLKKAAAMANNALKPEKMTSEKLDAISKACDEVIFSGFSALFAIAAAFFRTPKAFVISRGIVSIPTPILKFSWLLSV